ELHQHYYSTGRNPLRLKGSRHAAHVKRGSTLYRNRASLRQLPATIWRHSVGGRLAQRGGSANQVRGDVGWDIGRWFSARKIPRFRLWNRGIVSRCPTARKALYRLSRGRPFRVTLAVRAEKISQRELSLPRYPGGYKPSIKSSSRRLLRDQWFVHGE